MTQLLIASKNPGKIKEFRSLLCQLPLVLVEPGDLGLSLVIKETDESYAANASKKAITYACESAIWTLADDSGLEVDVLDGAPGIRSARVAGPNRTDADRRQYLLHLLRAHSRPWKARFRCSVALANPEGEVTLSEGICEGEIIPVERGKQGFGYDPIFLLPEVSRTMAELSLEEKNQLSHRGRAIKAIIPLMREKLELNQ